MTRWHRPAFTGVESTCSFSRRDFETFPCIRFPRLFHLLGNECVVTGAGAKCRTSRRNEPGVAGRCHGGCHSGCQEVVRLVMPQGSPLAFQFASERLCGDKELALAAVRVSGKHFQCVSYAMWWTTKR